MKLYLVLLSIFLLEGCVLHYDSLEYYKEGYSPNNENFQTKGYYYKTSDSTYLDHWPNAVRTMSFFENGTFKHGANAESLDSLDSWICKNGEKQFRYGPFGFYTIQNDTILSECISTDPMGDHKARRFYFKAIQTDYGIKVIEKDNEVCDEDWFFHRNDCVPDSIQNWLITHRKYKLRSKLD